VDPQQAAELSAMALKLFPNADTSDDLKRGRLLAQKLEPFDFEICKAAIEEHRYSVKFLDESVLMRTIQGRTARAGCMQRLADERQRAAQQVQRIQSDIELLEAQRRRELEEVESLSHGELDEILQILINEHSNKPVYLKRLKSPNTLQCPLVVALIRNHIKRCESA
jgi:hypothetical protein